MNKQMSSVLAQGDNTPVVLNGVNSNEVRITSVELVELINTFRKEEGNNTEKRHSDLMTSIATEINALDEAGIGQRNFSLTSYIDSWNREKPCYSINKAGTLQMLNKESAVVRYKTTQYIEKLEEKIKEQQTLPQELSPQLQYLINMELEQKKIKQQLEVVTHNTETAVNKAEEVEHKLDKQMTINATQQKHIQDAVKKKVYERLQCCKAFDLSFDTAEHKAQFFSSLYSDLKKRFGVPTYRDILFVDYEAALTYVKAWIEPADIRG